MVIQQKSYQRLNKWYTDGLNKLHNLTWYTKCYWITGIVNTINTCCAIKCASIFCSQIITNNTLCCFTMWKAFWSSPSISITSWSIPVIWIRNNISGWPITWCHNTCKSNTTQYGIVKCVIRFIYWCTSWIPNDGGCKLTKNAYGKVCIS